MHRFKSKLLVAFLALILVTLSLITSQATIASSPYTVPFNPNSIWNKPIPSNPALDPKSAQMIQLLSSTVGTTVNIDGINGAWSVPVYYAPAGTGLQQVCDTNHYRPCEMVPIPSGMFPSPDADGKTVIVDQSSNHAWSFYALAQRSGSGGGWTSLGGAFGWGYANGQGDGIHNYDGGDWGGRVAGWNYYAGLIHPEEIQAGVINHAIVFMIPRQVATASSYVWPAAGTDGSSTNANSIPIGAHIQLDPSINVNNLPLSAGGKMIARALQVYGGWIADTGVAAAVDAEEFVTSNGTGINSAAWNGLLTYRDLYGIPVNSLRVLQVNRGNFYVESSSPSPTPTHAATNTPTRVPTQVAPTNTPTQNMSMSAPTVYASMDNGASDWKVASGTWLLTKLAAYQGTGLGWLATGATGKNILMWHRLIDLRKVPNAYLWVQSILSANNTAYVQVSLNQGSTWTTLGTTITSSSAWRVPSIDLSAYVGKIIELRFVWTPKLVADVWKFDDVTIGVLQNEQAMDIQANNAAATVVPRAAVEQSALTLANDLAASATVPVPTDTSISPTDAVMPPTDTSLPPTALPFPTVDISQSSNGGTDVPVPVETSESIPPTDLPLPTQDSSLPTALPFPTLRNPVDLPELTVTVPPTETESATQASALPISAPTVYDNMDDGAHDWQATGNWTLTSAFAYQGTGLGWQSNGGTANLLRWNRQIDLRNVPNAHLWVQSILSSVTAPLVQVSTDGVLWTSIGTIPTSSDWQVASTDLTPYVGQVIQLQFLWVSQNSADFWRFDDVTVGVLGTDTPAPTASPITPTKTVTIPDATDTLDAPTQVAPTSEPATAQPPTQVATDVPTQVPTDAPRHARPTQVSPPAAASTEAS